MTQNNTPHGFEPSYSTITTIRHYYGDSVRELMLGGVVLMLLTSPLYAYNLRVEFPIELVGGVAAVCFAALTSPQKRWTIIADAVLTGVALVMFQGWAILSFSSADPVAFVLREAIAIIALFSLYLSIKTIRAMALHQIGQDDPVPDEGGVTPSEKAKELHGDSHIA